MKIYCFTSEDLKNIWAGVGSQKWAVSQNDNKYKMYKTKGQKMNIGSFGIFYSTKEQIFTTPFIVKSHISETVEADIWKEDYMFPFEIRTIGTPYKNISKAEIQDILYENGLDEDWYNVFRIGGLVTFVDSEIPDKVWEEILVRLM
ncbi:hypothetical protein [Clostridium sp. HMP27]|uniref:hypothetical protein n=1 Tax=Clostridium sp. HMP27 TaxID=1487921 RepID=UPI00052C445B|nr:hypothetical protein [Clostridium sp. HMP27]KGK86555.1 hypothetical protein DP68_13170 [Clostridium sp. HMP27]